MTERLLADGSHIHIKGEPYTTCTECTVKDWCGRRSGDSVLPTDYERNPDCNGYVMIEQALKLSRVSPEFRFANKRNYTFDNDNIGFKSFLESTFDRVEDFVRSGTNIALIHPKKGTGKTKTACTVINEFIYKCVMKQEWFDFENPMALYIKFGEWSNRNRNMYQLNDPNNSAKLFREMEQMKNVPLLVIDDIGSGRVTDMVRDLTYDLIDYRKEHKKSTIFTTNVPLATLEKSDYLGDIITSRMMFRTVLCEMGGRDRRQDETY